MHKNKRYVFTLSKVQQTSKSSESWSQPSKFVLETNADDKCEEMGQVRICFMKLELVIEWAGLKSNWVCIDEKLSENQNV